MERSSYLYEDDKIAVGFELFVAGEEVQRLGDRLGNQHPIKWVTMVKAQGAQRSNDVVV